MPVLVLQRGHVPRATGATGGPGEQAMARRVAAAVVDLMPHAGWTVRVIDADEPGSRYRGDAFVSLHGDASASTAARGASVGYRNAAGQRLAQRWKAAYARHGWPYAFRADNYTSALSGYYGHRIAVAEGNLAACIVEHGFMTNPVERLWIDSPLGTRVAALAVVEAVTGSVPGSPPVTPPPVTAPPVTAPPTGGTDVIPDRLRGAWERIVRAGVYSEGTANDPLTRAEAAWLLEQTGVTRPNDRGGVDLVVRRTYDGIYDAGGNANSLVHARGFLARLAERYGIAGSNPRGIADEVVRRGQAGER